MSLIKPSFSTGYAKNASESANPNLWKGLVGAWMPSLGITGSTLKDVSGNGNDGTLTNMDAATDWVATSKGLALDFDGSDDIVSCSDIKELNNTNELTVCYWCQKLSSNRRVLVGSQISSTNGFWLQWENNNRIYWNPRNGFSYTNQYVLNYTSEWFFLCGTYNGRLGSNGLKAFANGSELPAVSSHTPPSSLSSSVGNVFEIGALSFIGFYSAAKISNVTLYNRALSPTEIKQLYLNPSAPFQKKTTTVVSVPVAPPTTTAKAVVLKKPKPSYATGYARNASESANPNLWKGLEMAFVPDTTVLMKDRSGHGRSVVSKTGDPRLTTLSGRQSTNPTYPTSLNSLSVKAVEFDGNDGLNIDAKGFTRSAGQPLSCFTVYQRTDSAGISVVGCRNGSGSGDLWSIGNNGFTETFFRYDPTGSGAKIAVSDLGFRNTYAICGVYNGTRLQLYVNGVKRVESASLPNAAIDQSDYRIGYLNTSPEYFYGKIGPTYIYSKALTASEIKKLTANPLAPFERKQQMVGISTAQAFNPYWANQATQLAGTLQ